MSTTTKAEQPYTDCECQDEVDHTLFVCECGCHRGIWEDPRP